MQDNPDFIPWRPQEDVFAAAAPVPARPGMDLQMLDDGAYRALYDKGRQAVAAMGYYLPPRFDFESAPYIRPTYFGKDPRVQSPFSQADYKNSGYDRGHLVPSRAMQHAYGPETMRRTFKVDQITPQKPDMNRGPWHANERLERLFALNDHLRSPESLDHPNEHGLWVIDGPIYGEAPRTIGRGVPVPEAHYKIMMDVNEKTGEVKVLPLIMPQDVRRSGTRLKDYVTTIEDIQKRTGLEFNPLMPQELRQGLAAAAPDHDYWQTGRLLISDYLEPNDVFQVLEDRFGKQAPMPASIRRDLDRLNYGERKNALRGILREAYTAKGLKEFGDFVTNYISLRRSRH